MILTNYKIIKKLVEKYTNIKDLSIPKHNKMLTLSRCIYYQLCFDYQGKKYSHTEASKTINREHHNSNYGLKSFDKFYGQNFFKEYANIYVDCSMDLLELEVKINTIVLEQTK